MAGRRSAGFVSKRAHQKSRNGCSTCKKKKVKCDEAQPICGYCALRKLNCEYFQEKPPNAPCSSLESRKQDVAWYASGQPEPLTWLVPAANTSAGQLTTIDLEYLHHYKQSVWHTMSHHDGSAIQTINRDWTPQKAMSTDFLLYSILSLSARHAQTICHDRRGKAMSLEYRTKALKSYTAALTNITSDSHETILVTSMYMMGMVPPPDFPCDDVACLEWLGALFSMMQGLRVLAGLKWAAGIEKLVIYPIFRRELLTLPPPPLLSTRGDSRYWACGEGEEVWKPNPPSTYQTPTSSPEPRSAGMDMSNLPFRPQELMRAGTSPHAPKAWKKRASWQLPFQAFLPPLLMALLKSLVEPVPQLGSAPIDLHGPTLVPALHALSPIFLSLYYYHLSPDFCVRTFVLPTFLTPEFFRLVAAREPRALVVVGWWFAFIRLVPNIWWLEDTTPRVLQAVSNAIIRSNNAVAMGAMEGAYKVVRDVERLGKEQAARGLFATWEGVHWEEGPLNAQQWEKDSEALNHVEQED